jgi:hypothetical protein
MVGASPTRTGELLGVIRSQVRRRDTADVIHRAPTSIQLADDTRTHPGHLGDVVLE